MKPFELILIRHGETTWNVERRYQGHTDVELSDIGREQARALTPRLAALEGTCIVYSSDLRRALETARIACPWADIKTDPRLRELRFGDFEANTYDENLARFESIFSNWMERPEEHSPPNGETVVQLHARLTAWLRDLPPADRIVAFAHGGVLRAMASRARGQLFATDISIRPTRVLTLQIGADREPIAGSESWS